MTQHYKDSNNKIYGYKPQGIEVVPVTIEEAKAIIEANKPAPTNEELEEQRIENINSYTQSFITNKYPLEKQSSANLGIYGDEYKKEMISFISNCITLSNEAIENNTSFEDYKAMLNKYWKKGRLIYFSEDIDKIDKIILN